ncbi:MAG: ribosomal protein S18-alanine N-acetyltransferase [SAR86 cluster bacterium]|jgi:ribosomal-protein-alanine N-acetyltransferase|nr:ribosomal protein S18-alanine N-acetyltransferase [SAR86 cluster bacterium]MDG2347650.1 ribosomal protein S18-alanine N-acetyltransferase [SAR86 cluster bacterium]|tara:strand:+ start:1172 stop:1606 length:435 start_codon:yes stop_codon:yes gene_type:complete
MKIRLACMEDFSPIVEIENATNQLPWTKQQFISSMEVGHHSLVLEESGMVVGFAIYSPIIPESHLLNIAIDPAHQGKGFGKNLLQHVILQNETMGVKIISLEVRVSNKTAINLYENLGFSKDAIRPNYYSGSPKEDALLMSIKI